VDPGLQGELVRLAGPEQHRGLLGQSNTEVKSSGRLANATFLIGNGDNTAHTGLPSYTEHNDSIIHDPTGMLRKAPIYFPHYAYRH